MTMSSKSLLDKVTKQTALYAVTMVIQFATK